jgi:tetratricopeptide (TPR) repeat protein
MNKLKHKPAPAALCGRGESSKVNRKIFLAIICLVLISSLLLSCAPKNEKYVKNGREYGVVDSFIWRPTWWNFYQRGISFAEGDFREEAIDDLQIAVGTKDGAVSPRYEDQRRVRTYGLHFIEDFFPHRELGILYYKQGDYDRAKDELVESLAQESSAKAKYYLNLVNKELLQAQKPHSSPPVITILGREGKRFVNTRKVIIEGIVRSPNYINYLSMAGKKEFIELAEQELKFTREISLNSGENQIEIISRSLLGEENKKTLDIYLDLQPPAIYVEDYTRRNEKDVIRGTIIDDSDIIYLSINGEDIAFGEAEKERPFSVEIEKGGILKIEAEDKAGNRAEIEINPSQEFAAAIGNSPRRVDSKIAGESATDNALPGSRIRTTSTSDSDSGFLSVLNWFFSPQSAYAAEVESDRDIPDNTPPGIDLQKADKKIIVPYEKYYLDGIIKDRSKIRSVTINGEEILQRPSIFFPLNYMVELTEGDNPIEIVATDIHGNRSKKNLVITRKTPELFQTSSRYTLALLPLKPVNVSPGADEKVYSYLMSEFLGPPERFNFVVRDKSTFEDLLQELKIGSSELADPETALEMGRLKAAEGILYGKVIENNESIKVGLALADTETTKILHYDDVYSRDKSDLNLQHLMAGLVLKFKQEFPLITGEILDTQSDGFLLDKGVQDGIKLGIKVMVYRPGAGGGMMPLKAAAKNLEARVESAGEKTSYAGVLKEEGKDKVRTGDFVITK